MGLLSQLSGAIKQGVKQGIDNGIQSSNLLEAFTSTSTVFDFDIDSTIFKSNPTNGGSTFFGTVTSVQHQSSVTEDAANYNAFNKTFDKYIQDKTSYAGINFKADTQDDVDAAIAEAQMTPEQRKQLDEVKKSVTFTPPSMESLKSKEDLTANLEEVKKSVKFTLGDSESLNSEDIIIPPKTPPKNTTTNTSTSTSSNSTDQPQSDKSNEPNPNATTVTTSEFEDYQVVNDEYSDILKFEIPDWGYDDFINERALWQKQISSILDEPGYFYFKVFFKFNTQHGLFGGLLNDKSFSWAVNSAAKYLYMSNKLYRQERPFDRIVALFKFASLLSYINSAAPWFFRGVRGLNTCSSMHINEFSKEKTIELDLAPEAVDMRLTTLMSLYKFACYDDINCKEIIPENLRKFDMSIMVFAAPIRRIHSAFHSKEGDQYYKSLSPLSHGFDNTMSFKMYTFKNCEFDMDSFAGVIPAQMQNAAPFQMGTNSIKIKYDRVYEHNMNEFYEMMFGSNGIYYNEYSVYQKSFDTLSKRHGYSQRINASSKTSNQAKRIDILSKAHTAQNILARGNDNTNYKYLIDATEGIIHSKLIGISQYYALGNLYGDEYLINKSYMNDGNRNLPLQVKPGNIGSSDYYREKLVHLKNRLKHFYTNDKVTLLKQSEWQGDSKFGNLYAGYGIGSPYYYEKLRRLKESPGRRSYDDYNRRK